MARPARSPSDAFLVTLAVLLAVAHAIMATTAKIDTSVTFDEIAHLTAGHIYNERGDFRFHPENGNLPQRWAALPMQWIDPRLPPVVGNPHWGHANVWAVGRAFLYRSGNNTDFIVFCGRAIASLFSAGTGLLIFFYSRRLFGWGGAFLSLTLFALCPSFLAHGALATSDVVMTFFFLAATTAWWWMLQRPTLRRMLVSAAVFALACVAKFSAVLLGPMMFLLAALQIVRISRQGGPWTRSVLHVSTAGLVHGVAACLAIWTFFGFRYHAVAEGAAGFYYSWAAVLQRGGIVDAIAQQLRATRMLPEAFTYGLSFVNAFSHQRVAFLNGELSLDGWWHFFPFAFLVKTPLPLLLLAGLGAVLWIRRVFFRAKNTTASDLWRVAPLLVLLGVYWIAAISSNLNIGHRHLLPTYPPLFILLGAIPALLRGTGRVGWGLLAGLVGWQALESAGVRPYYLAYFNQLVGGPRNGYLHLVDSSLDWGQELPRLSRWLKAHAQPAETVYLAYFGTGDPAYEGIAARRLLFREDERVADPWRPLKAGLYCVSATALQQPEPYTRRGWSAGLETRYQSLRRIAQAVQNPSGDQAAREGLTADELLDAGHRYALLRFQRLGSYLRVRRPDASVGYSILIYRLEGDEIDAATEQSLSALAAAAEKINSVPAQK